MPVNDAEERFFMYRALSQNRNLSQSKITSIFLTYFSGKNFRFCKDAKVFKPTRLTFQSSIPCMLCGQTNSQHGNIEHKL